MDENNKNENDKVSRIEDYTSPKKDDKESDDVSLFRRNKDFRNRKRKRFGDRVKDDEYSNNNTSDKESSSMNDDKLNDDTSSHLNNHHHDLDNDKRHDHQDENDNDDNQTEFPERHLNDELDTEEAESNEESPNHNEVQNEHKDHLEQERHNNNKGFISKIPFVKKKEDHSSNKNEPQKPLTLEEKRALRRKRQKRIQFTIITLLVLLIVIFLLYMFTPLSKISNVNIKGNNNVSTSKINNELNVTSHSRMYTFSKNKAINNLKKNPLIKDVEIHKQLPNTLNVKVTEYQVVGLEKSKDNYVPIIEDGKELKDYSDDVSDSGPIIDGFKGNKKTRMIQALSEMSPEVRSLIAEVSYAPEKNKQNRIEIFTKDDIQVVGDITTIANKMKYYPQMSQSLSRDDSGNLKTDGYIDLSVGASFIPYSGSSSTESESNQNVTQSTQQENQAKEELQSVLNKINNQSKDNN